MFPPPPLSAAQIRRLDELAITKYGVPGVCLMENAGLAVARAAEAMHRGLATPAGPIVILCGKGNNGGDGFVAARHLESWGLPLEVWALAPPGCVPGTDAQIHRRALEQGGLTVRLAGEDRSGLRSSLEKAGIIIDALLGTGLSGPPRGLVAEVLQWVIEVNKPLLAVDIPSGLDADTGVVHGLCPPAQCTITFGALKRGFFLAQGPQMTGRVELYSIGIPAAAYLEVLQVLDFPPGPTV